MAITKRALLAAPLLLSGVARAQVWPSRAITIMVPNPPGGGSDFAARLFTEGLSQALGQPVVIDNRPGANGNIGIMAAVRAVPDGHTLLMQYSGYHAGNPAMMRNLAWDPVRDLAPVGMATMAPHVVLAAPNLPANTLAEFIAYARANPGRVNFASSGNGSIQHIAGEVLSRAIGAPMVHVPYRGAAPALQDVAGGRVEIFITTPSSGIALVQAGRIKALATASAERSPALPDVPTTAEAGLPGYTMDAWFAFFAPAGVPEPVLERLNATLRSLAADPVIRRRAEEGGTRLAAMTRAELDTLARAEIESLGAVIRGAGIVLE
ncbi:Bug family tripartite tricarboxylate transporter substrate binding protein [Plastoroseomonas arctica]|uniref:Tripartite tricarboxylate transporter substrate binding protein n=1 Tax=Plastoroseomonas arctica TaxID=1509237 RepID=A0AAF1KJZ2_9PROT|nr:tripartite tricarboxylate transporter substrate binding protein [Plastoroseomonas arctica]MBR0656070.1 tripartite tricarboxylate transporter substrate binding protein [Plastoroseomonas arctica]